MIVAKKMGRMVSGEGWTGRVASIHQGFINLLTGNNVIVSLLFSKKDMHPFGILINQSDWPHELIDVGESVRSELHDNGIVLYVGNRYEIYVPRTNIWSGAVRRGISIEDYGEVGALLQAAITSCNPTAGLGVLVHEGLGDRYTRRTAAVLGRAAAARGPLNLSDLIGLGIGLTPSGDDFLTGVALAEAVTILDKGNHRMLDRTALRCRIHTTSPAGRTLLIGALANQFPSYLVDVARAMCAPHPQRRSMIHHGVRVASEHGATSGIDSCVGIWWYLNWVIEGRSGVHHRR